MGYTSTLYILNILRHKSTEDRMIPVAVFVSVYWDEPE